MNACLNGRNDVVKLLLECSKIVDINIPESFWIPQEIKDLIKMHSMTVQKWKEKRSFLTQKIKHNSVQTLCTLFLSAKNPEHICEKQETLEAMKYVCQLEKRTSRSKGKVILALGGGRIVAS